MMGGFVFNSAKTEQVFDDIGRRAEGMGFLKIGFEDYQDLQDYRREGWSRSPWVRLCFSFGSGFAGLGRVGKVADFSENGAARGQRRQE